MGNELETVLIQEWTIRYREPISKGPHPVVWLFHGWKGDEESMSVFTTLIPDSFLILAPRGPYHEESGGFSWYPAGIRGWPRIETFTLAIDKLKILMENWPVTAPWADFDNMRLAGFSQGAALAYAYTLLSPGHIQAVAGLAGFLPEGSDDYYGDQSLDNLLVYIAHGKRDRIVPVKMAWDAVRFFEGMGVDVSFCESNVGHKLSADCYKGLSVFFNK